MRSSVFTFISLLALASAGCGDDASSEESGLGGESGGGSGGAGAAEAEPGAVTFYRDVQPILEARCGSCHQAGGIGPFPVDSAESVRGWEAAMLGAVESGRMPPWPPADDCRKYKDERKVAPAELEVLRAWVEAGAPAGDPADAHEREEALTAGALGEPDFAARPELPYAPERAMRDDYRCFVLDPKLTEDRWVRAVGFQPDNATIVHHIVLFSITPEERPFVESLDSRDGRAGYTCFGGPGLPGGAAVNTIGAWAPGSPAIRFPENAGLRLRAGSVIAMQVHYNLTAHNGRPDRSGVDLYFHEGRPAEDVLMNPVGNFALSIPAGDPAYTQSLAIRNTPRVGLTIHGIAPHMHTRGSAIRVSIERADGTEECLADLPKWDFHWQGTYAFEEPAYVGPDDRIRLTCTYDNGGPNARHMAWGEGTEDEMCLSYLTLVRDEPLPEPVPGVPVVPPPPGEDTHACVGMTDCFATCDSPMCELECTRRQTPACQECYLTGTFACGHEVCTEETEAMTACATGCLVSGEGMEACPVTHCLREYVAMQRCLVPFRDAGECNDRVARCAVEF